MNTGRPLLSPALLLLEPRPLYRLQEEMYLHLVMDFLPETIRSTAIAFHKQRQRFPTDHVRVYLYQVRTQPSALLARCRPPAHRC